MKIYIKYFKKFKLYYILFESTDHKEYRYYGSFYKYLTARNAYKEMILNPHVFNEQSLLTYWYKIDDLKHLKDYFDRAARANKG
jgi:hypothetical protein